MNRVIVAGGRDFNDYELLKDRLDYYLSNLTNIEIVSGGATGADSLGESYAKERNLPIKVFKADWNLHGRGAGPKRNRDMSLYGTHLVLFWDGKSKGSKNMLEEAQKQGLKIKIVYYDDKR